MTQVVQVRVEWDGSLDEMGDRIVTYGEQVLDAVRRIAEYFEPVLESYAKQNAPWRDRTGNARQSLHTFTRNLAEEAVALYLAHGMDYGIWLEVRWSGKYAIIWPTLEAHLEAISAMLHEVFS